MSHRKGDRSRLLKSFASCNGLRTKAPSINNLLQRFRCDESGTYVIVVAVVTPALIGTVGLGTEVAWWLYKHRDMQSAADSGTVSAATAGINLAAEANSITASLAMRTELTTLADIKSLNGLISVRTNSSTAVLYAVERGAGIGFLPTCSIALGAPLVAVDFGPPYYIDLWLTYHSEFRTSERHRLVIEWLRRIFDSKLYPCFRDEYIHPNDLVSMMEAQRESYGLEGFRAALPK